jgi:cbb3-type cytochrome oxidase subunit 3
MFVKNKKLFTVLIIIVLTAIFFLIYQTQQKNNSSKANINIDLNNSKLKVNRTKVTSLEKSKNDRQQITNEPQDRNLVAVNQNILYKVEDTYKKRLGNNVKIELAPIDYKQIEIKKHKYSAIEMIVKITRHNGVKNSFHAYIDSSDGKIITTWNQVQNEGLFYKEQKHPLFIPTGTIKE